MVSTRMADQVGRVLAGRYRLVAPLGVGAAGRVFLADDVTLRRRVAVKLLHEALAADEAFLRRFRAEATAAASLNHPHIVSVYDWGEDDEPFLVLEHLGGGNLRTMLDGDKLLTPSQALQVGLEAARGLDHAHRRGIVHRDVKPANLLFDGDGRLRIGDFGVARALAEAAWTEPEGVLVGSARYASPEQARGESLDGRSDVYSLALVLVEAVSGHVPFAAETTVATLMARAEAPIPIPEEAGPLTEILRSAGQPDPADRPDASAFGQALFDAAPRLPSPRPLPLVTDVTRADHEPVAGDATHHEGIELGAPEPDDAEAEAIPARRRRRRWPWVLLLLAVLAAAGGAAAWYFALPPAHEVPQLIGADETQALEVVGAEELGWKVEVARQYRDGTIAGTVINTEPPSGSMLREGSTLTLVVSRGPTPVDLPELEGMERANAEAALADAELVVGEVSESPHEQIPPGAVVTWFVDGTERPSEAPKGAEVDLVISTGPAPRVVPDLSGAEPSEARAQLEERGLVVAGEEEVFHSSIPKGLVVGTQPGAGAEVERGTEVTLRVSKGPDRVTVPDVAGMSLDRARQRLTDAGLKVREIEGDPDRSVLATDPPSGERVERGTGVVIIMRGFSD